MVHTTGSGEKVYTIGIRIQISQLFFPRTNHIDVNHIREFLHNKSILLEYVPINQITANILTKDLSNPKIEKFKMKMEFANEIFSSLNKISLSLVLQYAMYIFFDYQLRKTASKSLYKVYMRFCSEEITSRSLPLFKIS